MDTKLLSTITISRKLKLSQLVVFSRVMQSGSFVRASNALGLTQPAVSKIIFELESVFDEVLFTRSNRGVVPTDFGMMLGRHVQSIVAELRYLTDDVQSFRQGEAGHLIVGTLISAAAELLPRAIAKLRCDAPGLLVTIREGTAPQLVSALAAGELDIVVGRLPDRASSLFTAYPVKHEGLFEEPFCVVAGTAHPLAGKSNIDVTDLTSASWIFPLAESPARSAAESIFRAAGIAIPIPKVESLSLLANLGLMLKSDLLSFMPRAAALQLQKAGSLTILDMPATQNIGIVGFSVRADKELPPSCRRFIDALRRAATEITEMLD